MLTWCFFFILIHEYPMEGRSEFHPDPSMKPCESETSRTRTGRLFMTRCSDRHAGRPSHVVVALAGWCFAWLASTGIRIVSATS